MLPTVNDVGAVDPVLTNMLLGYMQDDMRFVAGRVFPPVPVPNDSGTYYIVTKKYNFFDDLEPRAPGSEFGQLGLGVSTDTYTTKQWAGKIPVPDEVEANNQAPMAVAEMALRRLAQASLIRKEVQWATDFMTSSVWGTDKTVDNKWSDYANSDPVGDVLLGVETIGNNTGVEANAMVLGRIVDRRLKNHPDILDRLKYTNTATVATVDGALAALFGVANYWVGKASYSNTNEAATFSASAIIDDDCLVCVVNPGAGIMGVTAGKTFAWDGGGGVGQIRTYYSDDHDAAMIKHKEQWDQKATATDCGYFFADVTD
ncbi:MAG: hypothetical protein AMJ53_18685 [Gammaproteobacteria bacterium SG8_11]|nr:MAG: hypothetical protein AMJ53_18685 [Gammaproteobacteria bacterium SG8_11]